MPASTTTFAPTTVAPTSTTSPLLGLSYTAVTPGMPFPVMFTYRPIDEAVFIATKDGRVWTLGPEGPEPYLDISARVRNSGEQGLLGMAWHPTDRNRFFIHYSDVNGDTTIAEFTGATERVLLKVPQPASNHNGGMIAFGPDGYLWIGLGDGGGGGDTFGNGQPVDDLLGGLLRIDVAGGEPYSIPVDNPFAAGGGAPEVWASGLRNPWRFSFDEGLVYIGDVGQNAFEEVNVTEAVLPAVNYGWPITEGLHCFSPRQGCDSSGLTLPLVEVAHGDEGTCSITGGVVYRGKAMPELIGHYFYSDYCGGWLRSFRHVDGQATESTDWTGSVGNVGRVVSFGTDPTGEIYVLTTEAVYRLDPVRS
ncbi:MAG: PQQ-dependent sugar dehydrogenase [Actinomycetota bacterium]